MVTAAQLQLLHSPIVSLIPSVSSSTYVKLDETNYLPWHFLMKMMLQGHGIMGFIDGSNPCPPQDVATSTHSVITSESSARPELDEFKVWKMHDHALMLLLTATLSSSAISCVIGSKSSQEMWVRLQDEFFLPVTRTSIIKLKTDMYNMKKGSDSVSQYLRRLKEVRDGLSILGVTFPDEDFVVFALNGLPPKYNTFKCVLRGRENIISLKDFRAQLLAEETIVDCSADWNPDFAFISAQEKQEEERTFDASLTGDLGGIHHSDSNGLAPSARNLGFLGHALKHSHGFRHDRSRLHQVQGTNNEEADPSRRDLDAQQITAMAGQQSIYGHNKDGELNSPSAHKLSPLGNSNATNFLTDVREGLSVKTSSQSAFQAQGMVAFGESDSQSPSIGNNVLPNYYRNFSERSFKEQEQEEELDQEQEQQLDLMNYHSLSRTRYVEEKTAVEDEKVVNNKEQTSVSSFDLSSSQGKKKSGGEGKEQDHHALLGLSHLRSFATEEQLPSSVGAESSNISRSHTICSQKYHFDADNKTKIGVSTQIVVHEFRGFYVLQSCNGGCIFDIQLSYHMRISDKGGGTESTLIWVLWYTRYNGNIRAPDARRFLFAGYACSSDQILYSPIVTISCLNHHELAGGC